MLASFHAHSPGIQVTPQQLRWDPLTTDLVKAPEGVDFVDGLTTLAGAGDSQVKNGLAIHIYCATKSMDKKSFYNSDGDMLIGRCTASGRSVAQLTLVSPRLYLQSRNNTACS